MLARQGRRRYQEPTDDVKRVRGGNGVRRKGTRRLKLKRELRNDTERGKGGMQHGKEKHGTGRGKRMVVRDSKERQGRKKNTYLKDREKK